jgi:hypothetical protein
MEIGAAVALKWQERDEVLNWEGGTKMLPTAVVDQAGREGRGALGSKPG